jgi:hypothetical protein
MGGNVQIWEQLGVVGVDGEVHLAVKQQEQQVLPGIERLLAMKLLRPCAAHAHPTVVHLVVTRKTD